MLADAAIAVMAKQPQPGRTKTRLCPPLSTQEAADLYEALLFDTLDLANGLTCCQLAVAITPPESRPYFEQAAPPGALLLPVQGADIGACLQATLAALFEMGYSKALALNADGPSLPAEYLRQAFKLLGTHDVVFGPGMDGGYYLVALRQPQPGLFDGIAWSTERVLVQSLERAAALGLSVALTRPWYDVDYPIDLLRLAEDAARLPEHRLKRTRCYLRAANLPGRLA